MDSCGRKHTIALDIDGHLWLIANWAQPVRIRTSQLSSDADDANGIRQIEAGWDSVAVLTRVGDVVVFWPFEGALGEIIRERREDRSAANVGTVADGVVHNVPWDLDLIAQNEEQLVTLPDIPHDLPDLLNEDDDHARRDKYETDGDASSRVKLVKIAAGADFIVGLTNRGHVLQLDLDAGGDRAQSLKELFSSRQRQWTYVRPSFRQFRPLVHFFLLIPPFFAG